jgi:hypothetical protein
LLLLRPEVLSSAVLFRPMIPLTPEKTPNLETKIYSWLQGKEIP